MPEIFFCADLHLGHDNIRIHCQRPWATIEEHDEAIITAYNDTVGRKDIVYIAGDFAWRNHRRYLGRLNGRKVLIYGNHDKMRQDCNADTASFESPQEEAFFGTLDDLDGGMDKETRRQFAEVVGWKRKPGILELNLDGHLVVVSHFPMITWRASCHGSIHLHGHSHGFVTEHDDVLRADTGIDVTPDYAPVNWEVHKMKFQARMEPWAERMARLIEQRKDEDHDYILAPARNSNISFRNLWDLKDRPHGDKLVVPKPGKYVRENTGT